ncbi:uncharacterized protein LOC143852841 [Tasmannia lanceolata]|uniref:uncharacterized protein LOC143852841 n=1 Tax=Tasmannia lanceolata TaxID=3420 RepID=UPI004064ADC1
MDVCKSLLQLIICWRGKKRRFRMRIWISIQHPRGENLNETTYHCCLKSTFANATWNLMERLIERIITSYRTVAERQPGPPVGLVDIGVSENAYLFHMYLPGVKYRGRIQY